MVEKATKREEATAADFVDYVAEARAEGLSDIRIFERYFRQARPGLCVWRDEEFDDEVTLTEQPEHGEDEGLGIVSVELAEERNVAGDGGWHFLIAFGTDIPCVWGYHSDTDDIHEALARIANQLAERCPVGVMTEEEAFPDGAPSFDPHSTDPMPKRLAEWVARNRIGSPNSKDAARIRRMFGIGGS